MKQIYLDNAATTPVDPQVLSTMKPYFGKKYGNASEPHLLGQQARLAVKDARMKLANFFGCKSEEIIFTSGATEAINLSHKGLIEGILMDWKTPEKPHIITSSVEHMAVLETCKHLQRNNLCEVTYLPVDRHGLVLVEEVEQVIRPETVLVSIMYVNNEVGTIEPIRKIGQFLKKLNVQRTKNHQPRIFFHTDATQAIGYLNCKVDFLGVDLLSLTGHKFYAPKGIGALYARKRSSFVRQMDGGGQEGRMRAGTENVPYIVALGCAVEQIKSKISPRGGAGKIQKSKTMESVRDKLIEGVLKIPGVKLTGHPKKRIPHIASFVIEGVEGESMVLLLSDQGIYASSGSACTSDKLAASHVLTAMGIPEEVSHGSLRFSLGKDTKVSDIDYVIQILPKVVQKLRNMAPNIDIV